MSASWSSPAQAVGTRRFVLEQAGDFRGGDLDGAAVSSRGSVRAGLDVGRIAVDAAAVIWCALARPDGSVLLGTGNEGKLLELRDARIRTVAETEGLVITSLVEAWGTVVFSTMPQGKLWKLQQGKVTPFVTLPGVEHVWQLAYDKKAEVLHVATGAEGKLLRVDRTGHSTVELDVPEPHLLSVAVAPDGTLLAGSSDKAKLYRVTAPGQASVLFDFGQTEVRAIAVASNGDVFAIANNVSTARTPRRPTGSDSDTSSSSSSSSSSSRGKGTLVRVTAAGVAETLLEEDSEQFVSLALDRRGQPFVGTGREGRVFTVDERRSSAVIADVQERQVTVLMPEGPAAYVMGSDPATIHPILATGKAEVSWTSKVFDAGLRASFGRMAWESSGPVELSTRTGNTAQPDDTWSDWSQPLGSPGPVASPAGRFIQVRARFGDGSSVLTRVEIPFVTDNQRAILTRVGATLSGVDSATGVGIVASGAPISSRSNPELNLEWSVDNPDKDTLRYRLYYRMASTKDWYELLPPTEVLTRTSYKWDTSTLPEGRYRVRVVATDELSNSPQSVTRDEMESGLVLVDNTPPVIQALQRVGMRVRGKVVDGVGPIQRIEVTMAGRTEWFPLAPTDRIFDESTETFDVDMTSVLPPGRYLLTLRAYDAANNVVVRSLPPE